MVLMIVAATPSPAQDRPARPSAARLIGKAIEEKGVVTAKEEFATLLRERDRYVFAENEFLSAGNDYLKAGKPHRAVAVLAMAAEAFPESPQLLRLLAHSYYVSGDEGRSLEIQAGMMAARGKALLADFLKNNRNSLAQTAEEVIARSIEATGGRKAWEAVETMVVVFSIQSTSGEQQRMVRMHKRPSLYRQGLDGGKGFTATDGTKCWSVSDGVWKEIENAFMPLASMDRWLLGYEAFGITHQFSGFDFINGSPVYHLRRTFGAGYAEDLFFSARTNLLTEIRSEYVQNLPFMQSFQSLWNYRDVQGVKIPFVFIRNLGPLEPPHGGVVEEVRINEPLDDALFLPPGYKR